MNDSTRTVLTSAIAVLLFVIVEVYTNDLGVSENKLLTIRAMIFCLGMLVGVGITNFLITRFFTKKPFPPLKGLSVVLVACAATFLLASASVSASTPQYTFTDSINTTLNNTANQSIGFFVFTKQSHAPDTINLSTFGASSATQFDKLVWMNTTYTVEFTDPNNVKQIITPGAQYFVPLAGTYTYVALSDPSINGFIVVAPAASLSVSGTGNAGPFAVRLSPTTFSLTGSEQIVNVTIDVPQDFPPNTVSLNVTFTTNAGDRNYTKQLTLPEVRRWEVINNTLPTTYSIIGGDTEDVGTIVVRNLGNVNFDVDSLITGTGAPYLSTQSKLTLFKNTNSAFDFRVRIPSRQADGVYNASIKLSGHGIEYLDSVNITVKDLIAPKIENLTFSDNFLQHTVRLTAIVTDNIEVNSTTLTVAGNKYVMTKDNNVFYTELVFKDPLDYTMNVCSTDIAGNTGCNNFTKRFELLNIINGSRSVDMLSKKHSLFASKTLFTLSERPPEGLTIKLDNFLPGMDTTNLSRPLIAEEGGFYSVRVVDGDGSYKYFTGTNTSVQVFSPGKILLEVRADAATLQNTTRGSYSGIVSVANQPWRTPYEPVSFNGVTVDYALPDAFKIEWGTGGGFLDCDVRDTGDLESSRGICNLELPAEDLSKDLVVPISLKEKQYLEDQVNQTTMQYEKRLRQRNILTGVLLGLLFILTFYSIWRVAVKPKLLWLKK